MFQFFPLANSYKLRFKHAKKIYLPIKIKHGQLESRLRFVYFSLHHPQRYNYPFLFLRIHFYRGIENELDLNQLEENFLESDWIRVNPI